MESPTPFEAGSSTNKSGKRSELFIDEFDDYIREKQGLTKGDFI